MKIDKKGVVKEDSLLKRFWDFLKEDSWQSMIVSFILALILIKFVFFPLLSLITGTTLPLVIVESCSMHHSRSMEEILNDSIYQDYLLGPENKSQMHFKHGLEKGDIILVWNANKKEVGDVLIFNAGQQYPIIHRIIWNSKNELTTKGDNNSGLLAVEKKIKEEQVVGKAVLRIPYLGWIKLIFYEPFRAQKDRGLC